MHKAGEKYGVALLLEPTPAFYEQPNEKENKLGWGILHSKKDILYSCLLAVLWWILYAAYYCTLVQE